MKISFSLFILWLIPVIGFCQKDSLSFQGRKNVFSFYFGKGRTYPFLVANNEFNSASAICWGLGFGFERKQNKRISVLSEIQFMKHFGSDLSLKDNSAYNLYSDYEIYRIFAHSDLTIALGPKFSFWTKNNKNTPLSSSLLLGLGGSIHTVEWRKQNMGYGVNFNENDRYLFLRGILSKRIKLGNAFVFSPKVSGDFLLSAFNPPEIHFEGFPTRFGLPKFKYSSIYIGLQVEF